MSFSGMVKEELSVQIPSARHCRIAELAAIVSLCAKSRSPKEDGQALTIQMENEALSRKCFTLLTKTFKINGDDFTVEQNSGAHTSGSTIRIHNPAAASELIEALRLGPLEDSPYALEVRDRLVVQQICCRKAFVRGAFLACGSMSDPGKGYHFEIAAPDLARAVLLQEMMSCFQVSARIVSRKKSQVVYVKEGAQIADLLAAMGAGKALMEFENTRILKEMRNTVNRKVNCETANIHKTVSAAVKQVEDIELIRRIIGLENLGKGLREMAELRITYPEATLAELGNLSDPRVGKSGVNHRLRKLGMIADDLRSQAL